MRFFRPCLWVLFAGCVGPALSPVSAPALDRQLFTREVEPVLERRCSNPSCHGNDRRPLRVYGPNRFRRDPSRLHLVEPLSTEELRANETSAMAFAVGAPSAGDSLLVAKPVGAVAHLGGTIWAERDDPELLVIVRWLQSGGLP